MKKAAMIVGLAFGLSALNSLAQPGPGGNFDPAEFRQRQMDRYREVLAVTSDDEWNAIQPRIEKILTARRELASGGMRMMGGFGGGGPGGPRAARLNSGGAGGGPDNGAGGPPPGGPGFGGPGRGPGGPGFGAAPSPEAEALQKAIDGQASNDEIKAKLATLRQARQAKQAKLEQAQTDLKKVLSVKQEAAAVLAGLVQ